MKFLPTDTNGTLPCRRVLELQHLSWTYLVYNDSIIFDTTPAKINFNQGLDGRKNFGWTAGRSSIEVREGVEVLARLFELF